MKRKGAERIVKCCTILMRHKDKLETEDEWCLFAEIAIAFPGWRDRVDLGLSDTLSIRAKDLTPRDQAMESLQEKQLVQYIDEGRFIYFFDNEDL